MNNRKPQHCAHVAAYYFNQSNFSFERSHIWAACDGVTNTASEAVSNMAFYLKMKKQQFERAVREYAMAGAYKGGAA